MNKIINVYKYSLTKEQRKQVEQSHKAFNILINWVQYIPVTRNPQTDESIVLNKIRNRNIILLDYQVCKVCNISKPIHYKIYDNDSKVCKVCQDNNDGLVCVTCKIYKPKRYINTEGYVKDIGKCNICVQHKK